MKFSPVFKIQFEMPQTPKPSLFNWTMTYHLPWYVIPFEMCLLDFLLECKLLEIKDPALFISYSLWCFNHSEHLFNLHDKQHLVENYDAELKTQP